VSRAGTVLSRFPVHLGADRPGTLLGDVVASLVGPLDVQSSQVGRVRAAHRLGDCDEENDLLLLAGLHGLGPEAFELVHQRVAAVGALATQLADPATTPDAAAAALATLPDLLAVPADAFAGTAEVTEALRRLAAYASVLDLVRGCLAGVVRVHRGGNGTVGALLGAAAAYLALDVVEVAHLEDRFWHVARCRDRLRIARPAGGGLDEVEPAEDVLALEENPFRPQAIEPVPRRHADRFRHLRGGFDEVVVSVRVLGIEDRTVAPQVVNVDAGRGVAYVGAVPDGQELRFESDGRITLAGANVTRFGFSFSGAVFASADEPAPGDFVFSGGGEDTGGRAATFAVSAPLGDAFDATAAFPHVGGLVEALPFGIGESRWAFFVGEGAFGGGPTRHAVPADRSAFAAAEPGGGSPLRGSVFGDATGTPPPAAGSVGFDWQEREPFAVRVWLPPRLATADTTATTAGTVQPPLRGRLRALLDRHRAGGVHVYVEHADDRWTMGAGVLREAGSAEPVGVVVLGTRLWPGDAPHPPPPP
jgi:hypothetical protein